MTRLSPKPVQAAALCPLKSSETSTGPLEFYQMPRSRVTVKDAPLSRKRVKTRHVQLQFPVMEKLVDGRK